MKCKFNNCIYNEAFVCILEEVQIDRSGKCDSREIFTAPKEYLENYEEIRKKRIDEKKCRQEIVGT